MKKVIALAVTSLAYLAGSAHAEGCAYSQHKATMASAADAVEESVQDKQAPKLLAQLRAQEAAAKLETVIVVPN